jgi:hypothetical protein
MGAGRSGLADSVRTGLVAAFGWRFPVSVLSLHGNMKLAMNFQNRDDRFPGVESWNFLTNHARVLLRIAEDPGARLRDLAAAVGITERSAYGIVTDLSAAGYVLKQKDGRRNRYQIQAHLPLPEPASQAPAMGDVLAVLIGDHAGRSGSRRTAIAQKADPRGQDQELATLTSD